MDEQVRAGLRHTKTLAKCTRRKTHYANCSKRKDQETLPAVRLRIIGIRGVRGGRRGGCCVRAISGHRLGSSHRRINGRRHRRISGHWPGGRAVDELPARHVVDGTPRRARRGRRTSARDGARPAGRVRDRRRPRRGAAQILGHLHLGAGGGVVGREGGREIREGAASLALQQVYGGVALGKAWEERKG